MPEAAVDDNAPGHPTAGIFLLLFKGGAMAYYIICGMLPFNFVLNFCIVTFLIVCDFWTVSNPYANVFSAAISSVDQS
jgi:Eukaryotic protein of unknown function (DUF846)